MSAVGFWMITCRCCVVRKPYVGILVTIRTVVIVSVVVHRTVLTLWYVSWRRLWPYGTPAGEVFDPMARQLWTVLTIWHASWGRFWPYGTPAGDGFDPTARQPGKVLTLRHASCGRFWRFWPSPFALHALLISFVSIRSPEQYLVSSTDH